MKLSLRPRGVLVVLVAAIGLLVASIVWVTFWRPGWSAAPTEYPGWAAGGQGRIADLSQAHAAADRFAARNGLAVGEVMQFEHGYYAELVEPSGQLATEVLISARSGAVRPEYGPAMMWNTQYGMHPILDSSAQLSPADATAIANEWLGRHRAGETASSPDAFPGYYTLHTRRNGKVSGMLSVNATTGDVWYHNWHGRFIAMAEPEAIRP